MTINSRGVKRSQFNTVTRLVRQREGHQNKDVHLINACLCTYICIKLYSQFLGPMSNLD